MLELTIIEYYDSCVVRLLVVCGIKYYYDISIVILLVVYRTKQL